MPNISNATVASGTGLSTAGNGGRKLVRLLDGALISAVRTSTTSWQLHKSLDGGTSWAQLVTITETVNDLALASKGNDIHVLVSFSTTGAKHYRYNDSGVLQGSSVNVDSGQQVMGNVSLAINEAGTELHAAWSSKNATYPNSFNIRYAKGTINGDGSVTWGAVEQRTVRNSTGQDATDPSITLGASSRINIAYRMQLQIRNSNYNGSTWTDGVIYDIGYQQSNPSAIFVPQSINGLANGRLWVAWHGKDATDTAKFNVRTAFSDDGGVTWSTPVKQTTGNLYDQQNASLTADKTGKVFLLWDAQNATTTQTAQKVFNGTWGSTTTLTGDGYTNVSALFDNSFALMMTSPPLVRQSSSGVFFSGNYNLGASVSPASGALGNKETASITAYAVTPEAGSTVTQIVERVNGTIVNTFNNPASLSRTLTVPTATWDTLAYFATHTASVTVTDSNGAQTVTTYSFAKTLANNASLLEAEKANNDARIRMRAQLDVIASRVGVANGSSTNQIIAAIDARNVVKRQNGTATVSGGQIVVNMLGFIPKSITIRASATQTGAYSELLGTNESRNGTTVTTNAFTNITATGFTAAISGTTVTWEAFG